MAQTLEPSRLMRRLLEGAVRNMSGEELSELVNGQLSPAECILRVKEYIGQIDYLDEIELRKLYLLHAGELLNSMRGDAIEMGDPKARKTYLDTLKMLIDSTERSLPSLEEAANKIGRNHAEFFVSALMAATQTIMSRLEGEGMPVLEAEVVESITQDATKSAMQVLEVHVDDTLG